MWVSSTYTLGVCYCSIRRTILTNTDEDIQAPLFVHPHLPPLFGPEKTDISVEVSGVTPFMWVPTRVQTRFRGEMGDGALSPWRLLTSGWEVWACVLEELKVLTAGVIRF